MAFLSEFLLGVSLFVDLLGLFPPPGVLRVSLESGNRSPWVVTFHCAGERVGPKISSTGAGDLKAPALDCLGAPPGLSWP